MMLRGLIVLSSAFSVVSGVGAEPPDKAPASVSFYQQIRPIFQAKCQGCHQPAKPSGEYVMTSFDDMLAGGESELTAIAPGNPDDSYLIDLITSVDGRAEMPQDGEPLSDGDVALVRRWIEQGAVDDSPTKPGVLYDRDHPPRYTRRPTISSIDYSPDGRWLAVAGFHEVLLHKADGSRLAARLIGLSERIESVRFSPDGTRLAVTGGSPGRMGEVQIWDVESQELQLSVPVTFDTIYGGAWTPDGRLVAFGCSDNTLRAIDAESGRQVLYQGAHDDWVRDTVFSVDGKFLVSVGRDMSVKLTEVETERFVDNITSITPGALRGGLNSVARHPERDEVVIGGADGAPKVYRMFRQTNRVIGDDANLIRRLPAVPGRIFSVAISPDGHRIAVGSSLDGAGRVDIYGYEFDTSLPDNIKKILGKRVAQWNGDERKAVEAYWTEGVQQIASTPCDCGIYTVTFAPDSLHLAAAGSDGVVRIIHVEDGAVAQEFSAVPIEEQDDAERLTEAEKAPADFIADVNPILSRLGCNQGTCHGAAKGKNGFKLSLRGYDAVLDVRSLTDDLASRRVNIASPDDSLMLLKATGRVPHVGGQLTEPGSDYYATIRSWIAKGAKLDLATPRVASITLTPLNPTLEEIGARLPFRVEATYTDGSHHDVTREAFINSGNTEVAAQDEDGTLVAARRGEAPILARYEGSYAATTLTVMGNREGFIWKETEAKNEIDRLVAAKWKRMKILPSELCSDAEFLRRVHLDLTGLPPTSDQVRTFVQDSRDSKEKRDAIVEQLVGSEDFVEHWTNRWADLLQVNRKFLGPEGAAAFRAWIRDQVASNTPYNQFVYQILTASGSNKENPAASYFKILRTPQDTMENTTHLFLGVRFNCNKCHDHPFERWTQDQYYQTAAFFARVGLKADPAGGGKKIGGTAVEGAKPLYEVVYEKPDGEVTHDRTKTVAEPEFPFACNFEVEDGATRRERLARWLTAADNQYFARSYVNRLWGYMFGVGIIEPIDDIRAGNPPTNPELLEYLRREFLDHHFDMRHILRMICKSRTYQLSIKTNRWNEDDGLNYSHAIARRLPAEVLYDSVIQATGAASKIPGVPAGTRAATLPDSGVKLPDGFLSTFGRPPRDSACECDRSNDLQLGPVMALISGPTIADAIADANNALAKLVDSEPDDTQLADEIFLRFLGRNATGGEQQAVGNAMREIDSDKATLQKLVEEREQYVASIQPKLAKQRDRRIAEAEAELAAYEKQSAPKWDKQQQVKAAETERLKAELAAYERTLPEKFTEWSLQQQKIAQAWTVLSPTDMTTTNGATLAVEADGAVFASGENGQGDYVVVAGTELKSITGIRLEALSDDRLPGKGPGRAPNGNFVLSEFELSVQAASDPASARKIAFKADRTQADFSQDGYAAASSVDGKTPDTNNGWAISPSTGVTHWATFELAEELKLTEPSQLTFKLIQRFRDKQHSLGKFRLSVTSSAKPIGLGLPGRLEELVSLPAGERSAEQQAELDAFFREQDAELKKKIEAVKESEKPLPVDPELKLRQDRLASSREPIPEDPTLAGLRRDLATATEQLKQRRLTAAQDLAWALINSPAFLFNH